ncbi:MAG: gamma-glutamylcyclotransferase [Pseudomonadota bacterium]
MRDTTWVFGYASLIWKQDFPFIEARDGFIDGWTRRLWQGSHDHRGTPDDPGRVATIIESPDERCYGRAFLIEQSVFEHLDHRENNGYERFNVPIQFATGSSPGVTYLGGTNNHAFLGPAAMDDMVAQILRCEGESGRNTDYVLELAHALRQMGVTDTHIEAVSKAIQRAE